MGIKENIVKKLLDPAGIEINGKNPWDPQVKNERIYKRLKRGRSLALGESYVEGWWDCEALEEFFYRIISYAIKSERDLSGRPKDFRESFFYRFKPRLFNQQTFKRSEVVAKKHYDAGNDLYRLMLGKDMQYTCAYWQNAKTLDEAQRNKLNLICRKMKLQPGMKILELGGGFGGLARFMAKYYDCSVTIYNIAQEQIKFAREFTEGLKVKIIENDYRVAEGLYDRVAAVGLCEHVGYKNYRILMQTAYRCLKDEGLFFIHTNGSNDTIVHYEPWMAKYIFPNSMIPSATQLTQAFDGLFMLEDWHVLSGNYNKTLMAWYNNFINNWYRIKDQYSNSFYRVWRYYLLFSAASHRTRGAQLWHLVLSKNAMGTTYISER